MKKKTGIAIAVVVVAAGASAGAWYHFKGGTGTVSTSADAGFVAFCGNDYRTDRDRWTVQPFFRCSRTTEDREDRSGERTEGKESLCFGR